MTENAITRNFLDLLLDADPSLRDTVRRAVQPFIMDPDVMRAAISPAFKKFDPEVLAAVTNNFDVSALHWVTSEAFKRGMTADPVVTERVTQLLDDEEELKHVVEDARSTDYILEAHDTLVRDLTREDESAAAQQGSPVASDKTATTARGPLIRESHTSFGTIYSMMLSLVALMATGQWILIPASGGLYLAFVLALVVWRRLRDE